MRTKIQLLAATVLAAAGLSTASAQVYSQNIVGYVNVVVQPIANKFFLAANPLDDGTNKITSLFPSAPNQTVFQTWNGTAFVPFTKLAGNWGPGTNVILAPGTGFFIKYPVSAGLVTNTFVGNVVTQQPNGNGGGTNTTALPTTLWMVGSTLPVAGTITDAGAGTLNLGAVLGNQSTFQTWNGSAYVPFTKLAGSWGPGTNVVFPVGSGWFVKAKVATNWIQTLP